MKDSLTVFVIKHFAKDGIFEIEGELMNGNYFKTVEGEILKNGEWCESRDEAIARCKLMISRKIKTLEKQINKNKELLKIF